MRKVLRFLQEMIYLVLCVGQRENDADGWKWMKVRSDVDGSKRKKGVGRGTRDEQERTVTVEELSMGPCERTVVLLTRPPKAFDLING